MPSWFAKLFSFLTPKRRWAQFSLGTMLLAVTLLCVWLADYVSPVRKLERQLSDPDEEVREQAAERLGYMGSDARSTTKSLLLRTKEDTSSPVRVKAVWALSRVSKRAGLLEPLLKDNDAEVSLAALEGMLWMGHDSRKLVPTLLELSLNGITEREVDTLFQALGPAQAAMVVPLLIDSIWSTEEVDRRDEGNPAASALKHISVPDPAVVPALIERLGSGRPEVKKSAAEQLLRLGDSAKEALPILRSGLHDSDAACAAAFVAAVGAIDPDDPDFLGVLVESLKSDDFQLPHDVAAYLYILGPAAANAAEDVIDYLIDRDVTLLWAGDGNVLKRLGPSVVPVLDRKLQAALMECVERRAAVRRLALWLGYIGPPAAPAVPTLIAALDCPTARLSAVHALGSIGKDAAPAVPRLLPYLGLREQGLSIATFAAFQEFGSADEAGRARLRPFLKSDERNQRVDAALVLAKSGEPVEQILPALVELAIDPHFGSGWGVPMGEVYSPGVDEKLIAGIASLGPAAVPDLRRALEDSNPSIRRVAAKALGQVRPPAKEAVPRFIELLDDEQAWDAAAEAIGGIGADARAAVPKLIADLKAMRQPPKPGEHDTNENDPLGDYGSGYEMSDYLPLLHALAGIGAAARAAAAEVLRLTNSDDVQLRRDAVFTLARIDPANPSLIPRMRRMLTEWEQQSAINSEHELWPPDDPLKRFVDVIWEVGSVAEPLAPDLHRMMNQTPLLHPNVRCYAAFALARFDSRRQVAVGYLQQVINASFPESFDTVNLAYQLLHWINGVKDSHDYLMTPLGVGP